jgi:hypothetical protein
MADASEASLIWVPEMVIAGPPALSVCLPSTYSDEESGVGVTPSSVKVGALLLAGAAWSTEDCC